ncbi:MAG TPA: metal-dependent transcriptional regulator [Gemmatirosa sp.]|nr:metal-dependent transcriptional regulator [Gemmatirosa sp.]
MPPDRAHATAEPLPDLTAPVEDYLKAVYELERRGASAANTDLAQRLGVAPASVTGMVRRLAEQGLLTYERYKGVRLTDAGRRAALRTLRRHRVIESYLATVLGYPWDRVHAEAERLEHAASDELIDRMAAALGDPAFDPHGAPIPTREGRVDEGRPVALDDLVAGERARVVRVSDEDGALLRYLGGLALRPGAEIVLVERAPFDGPLTVAVDGSAVAIGRPAAAQVLVEPVGPGEPRRQG